MMKIIKFFYSAIICLVIGIILSVVSCGIRIVKADVFDLDKVTVEYRSFNEYSRYYLITNNPFLPNRKIDKEVTLNLNTTVFDYFYWNNVVTSLTDTSNEWSQFRTIAWQFHIGMRLTSWLNLEYKHRSEHVLDALSQYPYPVQDSIGMELIIFSRNKKESLF